MSYDYLRDPAAIYQRSFALIRAETEFSAIPTELQPLALRLVHAIADPTILRDLRWSPGAVAVGRAALAAGAPILVDAAMVAHGITRRRLPAGNAVICTLDDPTVPGIAMDLATTRSAAAVELWRPRLDGAVIAIGNAPTALFHLLEILDSGAGRPALILGFPVGFVGAAESKAALVDSSLGIPFIVLAGRRGGSALAAAAVNALAGPVDEGMALTPWLTIIGIGEDGRAGLSAAACTLIDAAELLVGGERHLAMVPPGSAARHAWESPLSRTVERIADWRGRRVVVLASGDPMCYGVGVTLARRFDPSEITVLPQLGAFSLAAARLAWPLADCATVTVHGRPLERLLLDLAPGQRILVLSEDGTTPSRIAALLRAHGWGPSRLTILEHLGGAQERLLTNDAAGWTEENCADLNTVAIECCPGPTARPWSRAAGLPDEAFLHDGQLTKREIRAATIAALAPLPGQTLWDVGAGSGSIAIEFLRAARRCRAFAIEHDAGRRDLIARNAAAFGVPELSIVAGTAPAALADLPRPDAVFVGGGVTTEGMLEYIWSALAPGGRLVANVVTVEGEARLIEFHSRHGGDLVRIAVTRAGPVGDRLGWRPLMPVTQLAVSRPDTGR